MCGIRALVDVLALLSLNDIDLRSRRGQSFHRRPARARPSPPAEREQSRRNGCFKRHGFLPHCLWKAVEQKEIDKITASVRKKTLLSGDKKRDALDDLTSYLWQTRGMHNGYAFKYLLCDTPKV